MFWFALENSMFLSGGNKNRSMKQNRNNKKNKN